MSTKRNYGRNLNSFNEIINCYEYEKYPETAWSEKYKDREMMESREVNDLMHSIPKEVRWAVQEDVEKGALAMANHFGRTVLYSFEEMYDFKLPKEAISNIYTPGGPFESINYHRGVPQEKVVDPTDVENKSDQDGVKIKLVIKPNKDHYLQTAEMNKRKMNDYCPPCMHNSTSTAATIGSGNKSSRKTKGRSKRERNQLYRASGGYEF